MGRRLLLRGGLVMKKPILKWKTRNRVIIALALTHRYLWPAMIVFLPLLLGGKNMLLWMGVLIILFSAHTLIGYKLHWKHIFCSYQNTYRKKMTPDNICWSVVKKSDAYGVPIIFGVIGIGCLVCHFLFVYA